MGIVLSIFRLYYYKINNSTDLDGVQILNDIKLE